MPDRKGQVPGHPLPWPAPPPRALTDAERDRRAAAYDHLVPALRELRAAIHDYGGHGMPGFRDRAVAYYVMGRAETVLADLGEPL